MDLLHNPSGGGAALCVCCAETASMHTASRCVQRGVSVYSCTTNMLGQLGTSRLNFKLTGIGASIGEDGLTWRYPPLAQHSSPSLQCCCARRRGPRESGQCQIQSVPVNQSGPRGSNIFWLSRTPNTPVYSPKSRGRGSRGSTTCQRLSEPHPALPLPLKACCLHSHELLLLCCCCCGCLAAGSRFLGLQSNSGMKCARESRYWRSYRDSKV